MTKEEILKLADDYATLSWKILGASHADLMTGFIAGFEACHSEIVKPLVDLIEQFLDDNANAGYEKAFKDAVSDAKVNT